jgi:PKD repeat protein
MSASRRTLVKTTRDKARIGATWVFTVYDRKGSLKAYESTANMWANEGIAEALNALRLTTINSASAVALISGAGYSAIAANDTLAGHPGWTEFTGYTGGRPVPGWAAAASRSIAATGITFAITSAGTIRGAALVFGLGGTANRLGSMAKLAAVAVLPGDTVTLDIAISIPAPAADSASMLTNAGANHWLDRIFRSAGAVASLRVGFMAAGPTLAAGDAFGSHAGWTEYTDYSGATRPAVTHDAASSGQIAQAGTADIAVNGAGSIGGFFLTTNSTKGNEVGGVVVFTRRFPSARAFSDARNLSVAGANIALANFFRPPTALFSGAPLSGVVPFSVAMTDESSGEPSAWSWTASNGAVTLTSAAQNPSFSLTQAGSWSFTLVSSNEEGVSAAFTRAAYVSASAPAVLPPSISDFAISDATPDEDVSITFSATISNPLTEWILNPGDGSGNYSGTGAVISRAHTYTTPGTYTATLSATGPGGSATPATISGIVVSAPGGFVPLTTMRSNTSGAHWVSPVGLSTAKGAIPAASRGKILARYAGTTYPCQVDNEALWTDGTPRHQAIHVRLPAGYVAGSNVEIGYDAAATPPSTPNWSALFAAAPSIDGKVSIFETAMFFWCIANTTAAVGDTLAFSVDGASSGTQNYSRTYESAAQLSSYWRANEVGILAEIVRDITRAPAGSVRCYANSMSNIGAPPAQGSFTTANDDCLISRHSFNGYLGGGLGWHASGNSLNYFAPRNWSTFKQTAAMTYLWGRGPAAGVDPEDINITCAITRSGGSTFGFQSVPANNSENLTSGTVHKIRGPSPRVTWTFNRTDALAVQAYTGRHWFDGHQVRQQIWVCPLRDPSNNVHPWLVARVKLTLDGTGATVDEQVTLEANRSRAYARDVQMDVTEINFGGVNRIAGELAIWRDLYVMPGTKATWKRAKPLGLVDVVAHMDAGNTASWKRSNRAPVSALLVKTRGGNSSGDYMEADTDKLTRAGGYERSSAGQPFYIGNIKFEGQGGAAAEIGNRNYMTWALLSGDVFTMYPEMDALATNTFGAWPWYFVDEEAPDGANWTDAPPSLYTRETWNLRESTGASRMRFGKFWYQIGTSESHEVSGVQPYGPWAGQRVGTYGAHYFPTTSHAPAHAGRDCYLLVPEERFARDVEQYSWANMTGLYGVLHAKKTGGTIGDADHRVTAASSNGNRTFAWSLRAAVHAAAVLPDWHPRRAYWLRVVKDFIDYHKINCSKTFLGLYNARAVPPTSDYFDCVTNLPGDVFDGWGGAGSYSTVDTFKTYYVTMAVAEALDMEISTDKAAMTANRGPMALLDKAVNPYDYLGTMGVVIVNAPNANDWNSPNGVILANVAAMDAQTAAKTNRAVGYGAPFGRVLEPPFSATPFPDLRDPAFPFYDGGAFTFVVNYSKPKFHHCALMDYARHTTNTADRDKAIAISNQILSDFPANTIVDGGNTYEYHWGPWGQIPKGTVLSNW